MADRTRVLISGAGIAGPTLAYWLDRYGFDVTIVEKAPGLRTGGYIIFERFLGYKAAAFGITGYRPRDELIYLMYNEVGQQVTRFAMHGDQTMFLFTFRDSDPDTGDLNTQKAVLRRHFGVSG